MNILVYGWIQAILIDLHVMIFPFAAWSELGTKPQTDLASVSEALSELPGERDVLKLYPTNDSALCHCTLLTESLVWLMDVAWLKHESVVMCVSSLRNFDHCRKTLFLHQFEFLASCIICDVSISWILCGQAWAMKYHLSVM